MTYTDDGSGFVAHVTYDGAIGPPAIPLNNDVASTIPFQEDPLVSHPDPLQPLPQEDLDVIISKEKEEEEGEVEEDEKTPAQNLFLSQASHLPVIPHLHPQPHQHHQHAHIVRQQEAHHLHLDHNQLHALHLLQPPVPVLSPTSSLFDTEPAAILARRKTPNLTTGPIQSKEATRVTAVTRSRPVQETKLERQPSRAWRQLKEKTLPNQLDLSQFTLLGVGRVLG